MQNSYIKKKDGPNHGFPLALSRLFYVPIYLEFFLIDISNISKTLFIAIYLGKSVLNKYVCKHGRFVS